MTSLRNSRLILSVAMCNLALMGCVADTPDPVMPGNASEDGEHHATWADPPAPAVAAAETEHESAHLGAGHPAHWAYSGDEGPASWSSLSPEFASCKVGHSQSPIDIVRKQVESDKSLELIDFAYSSTPLAIFNNGHTVQVADHSASAINAAGQTWKLLQFHFHSPSEHSFDGKLMDLELHLVHQNERGELAVVGLLFQKGKENKALAQVFDKMPSEVTGEPDGDVRAAVDLASVIPSAPSYFTYMGSLTTPKCSENVHWFVLAPIAQVSEAQLEKFRSVTHTATNRPVQPLGDRKVSRPF